MKSEAEIRALVDDVLATLTIADKAHLTAAAGMFHVPGLPEHGLPTWPVTDGPNGARGTSLLGTGDAVALCIPCGTALGATWDPELIERIGVALGEESATKSSKILLAPTVNLHRSPLAGRNFECFSEDPLLTGKAAAAYVRGVQSTGVVTTVKHFVGNESETQRYTTDSRIDERTLRELYLLPFELTVTEGGTLGIMTSYNRVNGEYMTNQPRLVEDVLRGEWGFEGLVMTDWFAAIDTVDGAGSGVDLEMPVGGPAFGEHLAKAVENGQVGEERLTVMADRVLTTLARAGAFESEPSAEQNLATESHRVLARDAAAAATVLLRNEPVEPGDRPVLPLGDDVTSIAVIGPNAARAQIMGGGSAALRPQYRITPLDALTVMAAERGVGVDHEVGVAIDRAAPPMSGSAIAGPAGDDGEIVAGSDLRLEIVAGLDPTGPAVATGSRDQTKLIFGDPPTTDDPEGYSARLSGSYLAPVTGTYTFEMTQVVHARFTLDGEVVCDGFDLDLPRSAAFFGSGSTPIIGTKELVAGRRYDLLIEYRSPIREFSGVEVGVRVPVPSGGIDRACEAAAAADVAVVVVGTNDDWESEGWDRTSMDLPGEQDELIRRVAAANPRTVVVLNTGAPVHLPWRHDVAAVLQVHFGGQGMAEALADIVFGEAEPGGRLPTTYPERVEHNPSFGTFPGSNGVVRYGEEVFVGYRWYESRRLPVAYPFGHGLGYTTFEIAEPQPSAGTVDPEVALTVTTTVTNTGERAGSHVVQCYVAPADPSTPVPRPTKELKAFAKVFLEPGESTDVAFTLDNRAFAHWHEPDPAWEATVDAYRPSLRMFPVPRFDRTPGWVVAAGDYEVVVGHSSADLAGAASVSVAETFRVSPGRA